MPLSGHTLSLSALTLILLTLQICETKSRDNIDDKSDLTYSDSSHGPQTAAAHQQVVYIDHGGGAISHIRRTQFFPSQSLPSVPSLPSLPFRPHVEHYPNSIYENNLPEDEYVNFPEDIPRIVERRAGPNQDPNQIGLQQPPQVSFVPQSGPQHIPQHIPPEYLQPHHQQPQPAPQNPHHPDLYRLAQPLPHPDVHHNVQPIPQPMAQPFPHSFPHHIPQPVSHPNLQHMPQSVSQPQTHIIQGLSQPLSPPNTHSMGQPYRNPIDDIEDERFLINNEIERIPKPSNEMKPTRREPPPPPPQPVIPSQPDPPINSFFDFNSPELFGGIDGGLGGIDGPNGGFEAPFDPFGQQINPLFQRRRLTTNNNAQDVNQNSIGYPPYKFYKGEDSPPVTNWPKIFKFTDGRYNLYDFEKQKKQNKIKFSSKEKYFDHISRDSFLILHGGTFAQ